MSEEAAQLEGSVARIVFSNPENHWSVLRVDVDETGLQQTVVGNLTGVREGEQVRVWGKWNDDPRYGRQLVASRYQIVLPATSEGIERYLGSGMIPGIGPQTAKLIVKRFGSKTFDVIDKNPRRLEQVKGVGKKKIARLLDTWRKQSQTRETMSFLLELGMSPALASRIYRQFGSEATARVRQDPYGLAWEVWGIGFSRADQIARELEIAEDDPARIRAGIVHTLREARSEGHVCLPREALAEAAASLLGTAAAPGISDQIEHLAQTARLALDEDDQLVYLPDLLVAERRVAQNLWNLADATAGRLPDEQTTLVVRQAEGVLGLELAEAQREAVSMALRSPVCVITGGPGTGKTTIVRAVVEALEAMGQTVALAAPTGRAAKRLSESTRREARTIHRLLEWQPAEGGFTRDENNPIEFGAVVLDEVSMVDLPLMDSLLRALGDGTRLLLVGDVDQLPSVGPGTVLRDVIQSGRVPVTQLRDVFRQAEGSWIIRNAHRILSGEFPEAPPAGERADFYWIERDDPEEIRGIVARMVRDRIPTAFGLDPRRDVQILTPMHRGPLGADAFNNVIGDLLNPSRPSLRLAPGDKVMQIRNNYDKDVFNGDVGFVERFAADDRTLLVRFEDGQGSRVQSYDPGEQEQLVRAWAISIHKSQGSEYPAVIVPVHTQHYVMLRRNLVYTAVTRGKRLVVLVGNQRAMRMAVSAAGLRPRHGRLMRRLEELGR